MLEDATINLIVLLIYGNLVSEGFPLFSSRDISFHIWGEKDTMCSKSLEGEMRCAAEVKLASWRGSRIRKEECKSDVQNKAIPPNW